MKKLFTLLTLLCAVTGAWAAEETVFLWQSDGSTTAKGTVFNATGGTAAFYGSANPSTESAAYNAAVTDADLKAAGSKAHKMGTNTLYLEIKLTSGSFKKGDIVKICGYNPVRVGSGQTSNRANTDVAESLETGSSKSDYNVGIVTLTADAEALYISRANGTGTGIAAVKIVRDIAEDKPTIKTQPESAEYAKGADADALTVEATASAGELSYQWYSNTVESTEGATAISGATTAFYTPSTAEVGTTYYYVVVKDDNGETTSDIAAITVEDAAAPTISIAASAETVAKNAALTLTATVDGVPAPTIQWFSNTTATNEGGEAIEGATSDTYAPSTATPGTYYFYAVATNSLAAVASNALTIVVTPSQDAVLTKVEYSNGFDAFIKQPRAESGTPGEEDYVSAANGTIKAYYLEGTELPTIKAESITVSEGATAVVEGDVLTVTAEDGVTKAIFDITVDGVAPYDGSSNSANFTGEETWVKTGYAFSTEEGKLGWKFSKNGEEASNRRNSEGKNRIYFFLPASEEVTFTNGGTARNIKVYRNGVLLDAPTSSGSCTIEGDKDAPYMIAIVSNQTSGDGALLGFEFKNIATGIQTVNNNAANNGVIYNLAGQRVMNAQKGLFIINGNKVVIK